MKCLKTLVTLLLALLWLPATVHCRLEFLPGLDFLSCCTHEDVERSASHHENDCQTDSCASVESGLYKHDDSHDAPFQPLLTVALLVWLLDEFRPPIPVATPIVSSAPPELSRVWQFSHRTALLPRAPSLAS